MNHQPHVSGDGSLFSVVSGSIELAKPKGEANPRMMISNPLNQNQLATPLYTQPSTSNGVNTDMVYQGNNSPSPQPGPSLAPKRSTTGRENKKLADKKYREKQKEGRKEMESKLEELKPENAKLKRKNESLKQEKELAEEKCKRAKYEKNQLESEVCRLRDQSASLQIRVHAFTQKVFAFDNAHEHRKQLEDELAGLSAKICWEDWMSKKLQLMDKIELLKYQNRILNVQVEALCEKKYKQREDSVIIRSVE